MKRIRYLNGNVDLIDAKLMEALAQDGRVSMKQLATLVGLSAPSVAERVKRLEDVGMIEGYGARLNARALGYPLSVFIRVRPMPGELSRVADLLAAKNQIIECDRVTGDDCFVARAVVRSVDELERLIDDILPFATTNTSIIQSSPVPRRMPPVADGERSGRTR